ncbi:MAG: hypothetical protein QOG62_116 [Thermoleophilaceae bacterium]|nr:hypothetical protein [Thermoleophilaceae bacterium]
MTETFDVVIVGARCAGSPLATQLARDGLSVCVLDKATFPSETLSTHGIQPAGVRVLKRLGVFDELVSLAPPIDEGTVAFDDLEMDVVGLTERSGAPLLCVRRRTLDAVLVDAARAADADVRTGTAVTGLIRENGRVTGVRTASGDVRSRLVVGADGVRSTVADVVGAVKYAPTPSRRIFAWAYFEGTDAGPRVLLGNKEGCGFLACPTDDGLFMAAAGVPPDHRQQLLDDREKAYLRSFEAWPELAALIARGRRVGPIRVTWSWEGYLRQSAGPGWALIGDAGHFKDPTPGQGIADALRQSETMAAAIVTALGGTADPDQPLREWWRWRDQDAWEMYWFAYDMGAPGATPPVLKEIQRTIAADPALIDGMVGVLNHDVLPSKVFTPSFALAAAARAFRRERGHRREVLRELRELLANEVRRRPRRFPTA